MKPVDKDLKSHYMCKWDGFKATENIKEKEFMSMNTNSTLSDIKCVSEKNNIL